MCRAVRRSDTVASMSETGVPDTEAKTARFASLQIPEYRMLWWGGMFIFLASQTQQIARGWLAYDLTGSNTALGGVVFAFRSHQLGGNPRFGLCSPIESVSGPS